MLRLKSLLVYSSSCINSVVALLLGVGLVIGLFKHSNHLINFINFEVSVTTRRLFPILFRGLGSLPRVLRKRSTP